MENQIKKAIKSGNSSAVILPRSWLNKEVRVELLEKTPEIILSDAIDILQKYIKLKEIIGIYLVGSYAREEQDKNSDIDLLIITNNIDREIIHEGIYNLLIISSKLLEQKLEIDLFPIGPMIKEAKPLLNSYFLNPIKIKVTKNNVKWYLDTTENKLNLIEEVIEKLKNSNKKNVSDSVAYTLVLRIRTLYLIQKLIENKNYSKRDLVNFIKKISKGNNAYEGYLNIKNNQEDQFKISLKDAERLYYYLKDQLEKLKIIL